jgi:hypothetical protein
MLTLPAVCSESLEAHERGLHVFLESEYEGTIFLTVSESLPFYALT